NVPMSNAPTCSELASVGRGTGLAVGGLAVSIGVGSGEAVACGEGESDGVGEPVTSVAGPEQATNARATSIKPARHRMAAASVLPTAAPLRPRGSRLPHGYGRRSPWPDTAGETTPEGRS